MPTDVSKYLSADSAVRGQQAHAIVVQLLQRSADPTKLAAWLTDLGARHPDKIIDSARKVLQFRRAREFTGLVGSDCVSLAAKELGVSLGRTFTLYKGEEIRQIPIPPALVENRYIANSLAFTMGEPGIGKTFFAVSLAAHVALGEPQWLSASIAPSLRGQPVVFALAEGVGMFKLRLIGALQRITGDEHVQIPASFLFLPQTLKVEATESIEQFIRDVHKLNPCLVVVDTYQRHGGPETEEERVNKAIENLTLVKEELGCLVNVLHHLPKDGRQTPRGHGAIDGSIDTATYLTRDPSGVIAVRFEQRDFEPSSFFGETKTIEVAGHLNPETGLLHTTLVFEGCSAKAAQRVSTSNQKTADLSRAIVSVVELTPGISQNDLCKQVGGNKAKVIAEIRRMVGAGELKMTTAPARGGKTTNTFDLPPSAV